MKQLMTMLVLFMWLIAPANEVLNYNEVFNFNSIDNFDVNYGSEDMYVSFRLVMGEEHIIRFANKDEIHKFFRVLPSNKVYHLEKGYIKEGVI